MDWIGWDWISTLNLSVMAKSGRGFELRLMATTTVSTRPALHHSSPGTRFAPVDIVEKKIHIQILDPDHQKISI